MLFLAVLLLRAAGFAFGVLNIDESDFLIFGAGFWKGLLPYRDLVEIKPPLGYLTYALAGPWLNILPIRVLGVFWVFATALVLRAAARNWTGSEEAGWAAAWLSLLAGLVEVPSFGSELMMNLPTAGALWFFSKRRYFGSGLCIGLASLYRHQGGIAALALGLAVLSEKRWGAFVLLALGSMLPWGVAAGAYAAIGQLPAFVDWVFVRNLAYAGKGAAGSALARGLLATLLCVSAALLPWILATRESLKPRDDLFWRALVLLLWLTWVPVALGGRFYEHYYLQFVPPLAVLGSANFVHFREKHRRLTWALVALPLLINQGFAWIRGVSGAYPSQEPRAVQLAQWVRQNSAPTETLFIWGHYTPLYTLSGRMPGTRYVNTSVHMGNFDPEHLPQGFDTTPFRSAADVALTLRDLEARKPALFIDTAPSGIHHWDRIPLFPEFLQYIADHYQELPDRPGGAAVYRRLGSQAAAR